jgi:hypothetical protein
MTALEKISRYAICLAAFGGLAAATPSASSGVGDQETYRCNTPNGMFDGRVMPFASTGTSISGEISLHSADIGSDWASLGKILSHQRGARYSDGDCGCNGIAIYAYKDHVGFFLTANGQEVSVARSAYDRPISFRLSVSPQGVMTVAIGKTNPVIKTVTLRHAEHNTLEMSCSGADVSFLNIATQ